MKNNNCLTFRNLRRFEITNGVATATVAYDYANESYVLCWDWGMGEDGCVRDDNYVHFIPDGMMEAFKESLDVPYPESNYSYLSHDTKAWLEGYAYELEKGAYECGTLLESKRLLFQQSDNDLAFVDSSEYIK